MIQPLHDWVLLRPIEPKKERKTASGLIMPANSEDRMLPQGVVLAIGPGTYDYNGNLHPVGVNVGDTVMYPLGGIEQEIDGEKVYLLHAASIIAIVTGDET